MAKVKNCRILMMSSLKHREVGHILSCESSLSNSTSRKETKMIGMKLRCPLTGLAGVVDAQSVQADGRALVRINDHWLEVANLRDA